MKNTSKRKAVGGLSCPDCGVGNILPKACSGRQGTYKNRSMEIPATVEIPTCNHCGSEWINEKTAAQIDQTLEEIFQAKLLKEAQRLLDILVAEVTQQKMEQALGLSQGYLSKIRSGANTPSPMLVACLRLLADNPAKRLQTLQMPTAGGKKSKHSNV